MHDNITRPSVDSAPIKSSLSKIYEASSDLFLPADDIKLPTYRHADLRKTADAALFMAHLARGAFLLSEDVHADVKPEPLDPYIYGNVLNALTVLTSALAADLEGIE